MSGKLGNRIVWRRRSKVQVAGHLCRLWERVLCDVCRLSRMIIAHPRAKAAQNGIGHNCADCVSSKLGVATSSSKHCVLMGAITVLHANSAMVVQGDDHNSVRLRISMPVRAPRRPKRH